MTKYQSERLVAALEALAESYAKQVDWNTWCPATKAENFNGEDRESTVKWPDGQGQDTARAY